MGYSKEKKNKKASTSALPAAKFRTGWSQKRPILFFVCGFCLLMILFYIFWESAFYASRIQPKINFLNSFLSSSILNLFGQNTVSSNEFIRSPLFSISVAKGCDAIEAMALFLSTTLAFPFSWNKKILGIILGIGLLFLINLARIVTLFFAGINMPNYFEMLHAQIWPVIIIIFATGIWIYLIRGELRKKVHVQK